MSPLRRQTDPFNYDVILVLSRRRTTAGTGGRAKEASESPSALPFVKPTTQGPKANSPPILLTVPVTRTQPSAALNCPVPPAPASLLVAAGGQSAREDVTFLGSYFLPPGAGSQSPPSPVPREPMAEAAGFTPPSSLPLLGSRQLSGVDLVSQGAGEAVAVVAPSSRRPCPVEPLRLSVASASRDALARPPVGRRRGRPPVGLPHAALHRVAGDQRQTSLAVWRARRGEEEEDGLHSGEGRDEMGGGRRQ